MGTTSSQHHNHTSRSHHHHQPKPHSDHHTTDDTRPKTSAAKFHHAAALHRSRKVEKYVFFFGEGDIKDKFLLGGKGAGLGTMTKIGLPVPKGFTISTHACGAYSKLLQDGTPLKGSAFMSHLKKEVQHMVHRLEKETKKVFGAVHHAGRENAKGNKDRPLLLLSVRSGAAFSMPGMMDTVLNLGLNDESVEVFAAEMKNPHFAWDSYRRFISMYGDVVMGVPHDLFEGALDKMKKKRHLSSDTELTVKDLKALVDKFKGIIEKEKKISFPTDPWQQLWHAVLAVFQSWNNDRAITYRTLNGIPHDLGTAVNVQSMVFGNFDNNSGTGVAFTRNPATGSNELYGEYLVNAQGEDVVAGVRTPTPIAEMAEEWPHLYKELEGHFKTLEKHYKDMQDTEFTVERGTLYMLQTRTGKRTATAAVKIAVEMHHEKFMTKDEALLSIDPNHINDLLHPTIVKSSKKKAKRLGKGLPASPGAGIGKVVFTAAEAIKLHKSGKKVVLLRLETSPEDISGMVVAEGILTARGGMTSHAAVVARGMGRCCVAGCGDLTFHNGHGDDVTECTIGDTVVKAGDYVSLDGSTGEVFLGQLKKEEVQIKGDYATVMKWADERRILAVRTNADTPGDARRAMEFGAQGIGLVRTEHMFFDEKRLLPMREMILADNEAARVKALKKLLPFQREDFTGLFQVLDGKPVTIRLLDPPLHEFLPHTSREQRQVAHALGIHTKTIENKVQNLQEQNPMLGFRGCRLGVVYPEITEMQVKAILQASLDVQMTNKKPVLPEIEVPLIGCLKEYLPIKKLIRKVASEVDPDGLVNFKVGAMIEVPRAALTADLIAKECDFLSFGTNDLTQMTCGFSRDDAGSFLTEYCRKGIYNQDPFSVLDEDGVGRMMKICVALARLAKPGIRIGICGEHGGDTQSIVFCHSIGLDDVSCSPFRVPVARLAAAQAAIKLGKPPKKLSMEDVMQRKAPKMK